MAAKTYTWVSLWFLITIPVIFWDALFLFFRPRSFEGGDLHWIWRPYGLYQNIDFVYGVRAWEEHDGFPNAQSLLNIVENLLNITYLYLAHVSGTPVATLVGFASVVMTLSKTLLYWLQEYYCGWCSIGHNNLKDLIVLWVIPNGAWIIVPSLILLRLGKDIAESLHAAYNIERRVASGKKQ
ncbi:hypothetical protein BKA93DRAFT_819479 [Sparassis latifolia]